MHLISGFVQECCFLGDVIKEGTPRLRRSETLGTWVVYQARRLVCRARGRLGHDADYERSDDRMCVIVCVLAL